KVQGSMLFLDVVKNYEKIAFGLRTVTQGGKAPSQEYYRLGTGPVVKWSVDSWTVHGSLGFFKETGLGADGTANYKSNGHIFLVGWQKSRALTKSAAVSWGAFFTGHQ